MMRLAWQRERSQTKDENELSYLLDKLTKLEELTVTRDSWKDVSESWHAALAALADRGRARPACLRSSAERWC